MFTIIKNKLKKEKKTMARDVLFSQKINADTDTMP